MMRRKILYKKFCCGSCLVSTTTRDNQKLIARERDFIIILRGGQLFCFEWRVCLVGFKLTSFFFFYKLLLHCRYKYEYQLKFSPLVLNFYQLLFFPLSLVFHSKSHCSYIKVPHSNSVIKLWLNSHLHNYEWNDTLIILNDAQLTYNKVASKKAGKVTWWFCFFISRKKKNIVWN